MVRTSYCAWLEVRSKRAVPLPPYKELLTGWKGARGNKRSSVTVQPRSKCSCFLIICWLKRVPLEKTKQCKEGHRFYLKLGHVMRSTHKNMAGIPSDSSDPAFFWQHAPSIHSSKLLHSSTVNVHHLPSIPQLPAMPVHSGAAMTHACCTHLKTPQLRQSSDLCFCTLDPTCHSCAMVPSSSSQTLPVTAGPTAYIKGLK